MYTLHEVNSNCFGGISKFRWKFYNGFSLFQFFNSPGKIFPYKLTFLLQECIPVECIPSTAVAVFMVSVWEGGVCPGGVCPGGVCPGGVCLGGCLPREGVCLGDVLPEGCLPRGCTPLRPRGRHPSWEQNHRQL